jgi:hypothetical protein
MHFEGDMRTILMSAAALWLCGCGILQQERLQSQNAEIKQQIIALSARYEATLQDPALDPIRHKVELFRRFQDGPPPFEISSNNSYPTALERDTVAKWANIRDNYLREEATISVVPASANALQAAFLQEDRTFVDRANGEISKLIVALYAGKVTYAEFAEKRYEIGRDTVDAELRYRQAALIADQQRQMEAQRIAAQQFANSMSAWAAYTQAVNARQPTFTTTTCTGLGNVATCNSMTH